ncbi:FeoB-associated Cys-rich membrane protein [Alienimonas sp. DA493]|uniref:FeoB-associated Cys-rich membrane protein n=1 Tax=Alienimonas sp. DA493 TaxID=3373605 RepID=UPI003754F976
MNLDPQTIAALLCVAVAAAEVGRRAWSLLRSTGQTGCGTGCGSCPAAKRTGEPAVVSLDLSPRR